MVRQRLLALLLLVSIVVLLAYPTSTLAGGVQHAVAQSEVFTRTITVSELGYLRDETLQGISVNRTYGINWPAAWDPQPDNKFTVNYSHSKSLETYSSMAVDWNGTRLGSVLLTPANADRGSFTVVIPADQIQTGYNQLKLEFYMGIHEDRCEDPNNPATWATVHSDSFLEFAYSLNTPEANLGLYPAPIIDNSSLVQNHLTFIIPDQASVTELNALAIISAKLGQLAAWRNLTFEVISESNLAEAGSIEGDVMYVGRADHLQTFQRASLPFVSTQSGKLVFVTNLGSVLPDSAGILWEQVSPSDPTAVEIFVTGLDDASLMIAARTLGSSTAYPRLGGELGVVFQVPDPDPDVSLFRQMIRFDELGYSDQTASGTRNQSISIILPLQREWQVLTEAELELHFAHSVLLHPKRSALTVSVNGSPVGSILLNEENAEDGRATFRVPAQLFKVGDNKISVTTSVDLLDDYINPANCDDDYLTEAWVVVYADTQLNLPGGPALRSLDLADYPFAFIGVPHLADLTFVVPEQPDLSVAKATVLVSSRVGRSAEGETLFPKVVGAQSASSTAKYQILIGQPQDNPAIQDLHDVLPQPFRAGGNTPEPVEKVTQLLNLNGAQGFIEAVLDKNENIRLVVAGTSEVGLIWAANALYDALLMRDLRGDLAIMDSPDTLTTASIRQTTTQLTGAEVSPETQPAPLLASWMKWSAGAFFLIALLVLFILSLVEINRQRKERKSYEI
jgi:hypothetical protein